MRAVILEGSERALDAQAAGEGRAAGLEADRGHDTNLVGTRQIEAEVARGERVVEMRILRVKRQIEVFDRGPGNAVPISSSRPRLKPP